MTQLSSVTSKGNTDDKPH